MLKHIFFHENINMIQEVMILSLCLPMCACWSLQMVEPSVAKTIIRLWAEVHRLEKQAHDFMDMTAPNDYDMYFASVRHREIRAIAGCVKDPKSNLCIRKIAYAFDSHDAPIHLLRLLNEADIHVHTKDFRTSQPSLYFESMFLLTIEDLQIEDEENDSECFPRKNLKNTDEN